MTYLIKMTLIWGVFYTLYYLGLRRLTFFRTNRYFLLGALVLGLWLPTLAIHLPVDAGGSKVFLSLPAVPIQWAQIEEAVPLTLPLITIGASASLATTPAPAIPWWGWVYLLGAVLTLSRFLWGLVGLLRLYGKSERTTVQGITVLQHSRIKTTFSFFRWIFWPAELNRETEAGRRIWQHECAHVRQGHSLDIVLLELLHIIFWFHPLVYLYRRSVQQVHEYLADAAVLRETAVRTYGRTLLWQAQGTGHPVALANHFSQSQLKNRILMMTRTRSRYVQWWRYALTVPMIVLFLMIFQQPVLSQVNEAESQTTSEEEKVFMVVEQMPLFAGATTKEESHKALFQFIARNIKYPEVAREQRVQGTNVVQFIVRKDGSVDDVQLLRDVGAGTGEESMRVIRAMPAWEPGYQKGRAVHVQYRIPIRFKLPADENESLSIIQIEELQDDSVADSAVRKHDAGDIFMKVDQMPLFAGTENEKESIQAVMSFIGEQLSYPRVAKEQGIEGTTVVQFVIDTDGAVTDVQLLRDVGGGLGEESLRVIKAMPNWTAGRHDGELRKVMLRIPIRYKLPAEVENEQAIVLPINTLPQNAFGVSPNPAKNRVELAFMEPLLATDAIRIFNQNGQLMNSMGVDTQAGATTRAITFDQPGVYYVQLVRAGGKVLTKKVVIQ